MRSRLCSTAAALTFSIGITMGADARADDAAGRPPIKAWESDQQGKAPTARSAKLFGIAPMIGRGHAGVSVVWVPQRY